jgi:hypothetical protein
MSHNTGPFPRQSNAALPNMARGTFPNQHAVQPPTQYPEPLNSHPPFRGGAPSFHGQGAPGQGAGTGAHSGPHPMVNGNVHGSINGNMAIGDESWIPSAHQVISNALRVSSSWCFFIFSTNFYSVQWTREPEHRTPTHARGHCPWPRVWSSELCSGSP